LAEFALGKIDDLETSIEPFTDRPVSSRCFILNLMLLCPQFRPAEGPGFYR